MKIDSELIETCLKKAYSQQQKQPKKSFSCIEYIESIKKLKINKELVLKPKNKDFNGAEELIKKGADVNAVINNYEETLLLWAVKNDELEIVKFLLTIKGIDINKSDYSSVIPLTLAAEKEYVNIVEYLIDTIQFNPNQIDQCLDIEFEKRKLNTNIFFYLYDEYSKNPLSPLLPKIDFPLPKPLPEEASFTELPLETHQIALYTNTNVLPKKEIKEYRCFGTENKSEINKIEEKINPVEIKDNKDKPKKEEETKDEKYISITKIHSHSSLSNPTIKSVETFTLENNSKSTNKTTIYQTQKSKEKEKVNTLQKGETHKDVKSIIARYNSLAQN